jgi:hypothetical protein
VTSGQDHVTGRGDSIWVESTLNPDGEPACGISWGPLQCYAPVPDVRETAIDLVTCAAFSEMMMELVRAGIPPGTVSQFATSLLSGREKRHFGATTTMTLAPAGSSARKEALVLLKRGSLKGALSPDEAREMAMHWLAVAEATESDQLLAEALRAAAVSDSGQATVFGYLRELRKDRTA